VQQKKSNLFLVAGSCPGYLRLFFLPPFYPSPHSLGGCHVSDWSTLYVSVREAWRRASNLVAFTCISRSNLSPRAIETAPMHYALQDGRYSRIARPIGDISITAKHLRNDPSKVASANGPLDNPIGPERIALVDRNVRCYGGAAVVGRKDGGVVDTLPITERRPEVRAAQRVGYVRVSVVPLRGCPGAAGPGMRRAKGELFQ